MSIERLSIHIKLKGKIAVRRNRKLKAAHHQYLKMTFGEGHKEKNLHSLLSKRVDALFEIGMRFYEEERKKTEEEITEVSHFLLHLKNSFFSPFFWSQEEETFLNVCEL